MASDHSVSGSPLPGPALSKGTHFVWVTQVIRARNLSLGLALRLVDGVYLTAWPAVAVVAPALCVALGFAFGWQHFGFRDVFSESWPVLVLGTFLGVMSARLGLAFLLGFALGDFFLAHPDWAWSHRRDPVLALLAERVPLIIEYALFGLLLTTLPLATKTLVAELRPPASWGRPSFVVAALLGHLGVTLFSVYLWAQAVPILIRPVFTWDGGQPPVGAMKILQEQLWPLLVLAGASSLLRVTLQLLTAQPGPHRDRVDAVLAPLSQAPFKRPLLDKVPRWPRALIGAAWACLLLSGMFETWVSAGLLGALILLLYLARERLIPVPLGGWARWVVKVPPLLRLLVGMVVVSILARVVLAYELGKTQTFRPLLIVTAVALIVFYLLNPGPGTRPEPARGGT